MQVRRRYALTRQRKAALQRVRKYLNEMLTDQLPLLTQVQRVSEPATQGTGGGWHPMERGQLADWGLPAHTQPTRRETRPHCPLCRCWPPP